MNETEETIDLGRLWGIICVKKKIVLGVILFCTLVAFLISQVLPKEYTSTTVVQTRSTGGPNISGGAAAMAAALGVSTGATGSTTNYIELMKTRAVLEPVIDSLEWEDEDKKPDAKGFAKKHLDIQNTKQTNLIEIAAKGRTPEEAQTIAQGVVDNFLALQTDKSKQTQSLLIQFLNGRIEEAKKDADESAQKFAAYSREHKLYSPEEQIKSALGQVAAYDKSIAELTSQQKAAQAEADIASQKLGEQKASSLSYQVNDNSTVQSIRSQIVNREVELTGLRQKYTENHPDVIAARNQLEKLQQSLASEVSTIVASNAASLNSAQMGLLTAQYTAQEKAAAAKASQEAIAAKKSEIEGSMQTLPDEVIEYMNLKSDSEIKKMIYTNLVQQCEQDRIQEAMESMDIQVIDEPNLPKETAPSGPRVKLITAIGFVLGCLIAFGYSLVVYKKEA